MVEAGAMVLVVVGVMSFSEERCLSVAEVECERVDCRMDGGK